MKGDSSALVLAAAMACAPQAAPLSPGAQAVAVADPCGPPVIPVESWRRFQFREYAVEVLVPPGLGVSPMPLSGDTESWADEDTGTILSIGPALAPMAAQSSTANYLDGTEERTCPVRVGGQPAVVLMGRAGAGNRDYYATAALEVAGRPVWISASNPSGAAQGYLLRIVSSAQPVLDGEVLLGR